MNIEFIDTFIKFIGIYLCISISYLKIINYTKLKFTNKMFIVIISILLSLIQSITRSHIPTTIRIVLIYFIYSMIFSKLTNNKLGYSIIVTILSISIAYIAVILSSLIVFCLLIFFTNINYTNPIAPILISLLNLIFINRLFKIKRFKDGFPFIIHRSSNDYLDIFVLIVNIVIIFMYFLVGNNKYISVQYLTVGFALFCILMIIILQKTFVLYQKQKLLSKTIKSNELEISKLKFQLETALQEKHNLVKSNHEFYHRQEALKQKLNTLLQSNQSTYTSETAEEYAQILDRINNLSKEYTNKTKSVLSLPKTNIPELDDMFIYLQSECEKYEIEFILKLNADINHMIETTIPKNKLETLIGDLVRNAIIAINHSNSEYKSIMIILGVKDNCFEFCVHDSGVEFKIPTLLKLGTEPATTHAEDGGTGIGFITTFETLEYCKASLIINENKPQSNNYTKSVVIRFDNSNRYIVNSYRADDICDFKNSRKDIIINKID